MVAATRDHTVAARVSSEVHDVLVGRNGARTFGELAELVGRWMMREGKSLDEAYATIERMIDDAREASKSAA